MALYNLVHEVPRWLSGGMSVYGLRNVRGTGGIRNSKLRARSEYWHDIAIAMTDEDE